MLISQYPVFDKPDNAVVPSIHYTLFNPAVDWEEAELVALGPGSLIVQVSELGDRNNADCEFLGLWIKAYPTPTTEGYDGSADYLPIGARAFVDDVAVDSEDPLFKRQPVGTIYLYDPLSVNSYQRAYIKARDLGSNAGYGDWASIPIAMGNGGIALGGSSNSATSTNSAAVGGSNNSAGGQNSAVVGGTTHQISSNQSVILGGRNGTVGGSGIDNAILGGRYNTVNAIAAIAIGHHVNNTHAYAVLINAMPGSNYDSNADLFDSAAANEFAVRAGSLRLYTNLAQSSGVTMAGGASSWTSVSDERSKADIVEIEDIALDGYRRLRIVSYAQGDDNIGAGVTAQDFYACFPFLYVHHVGEMMGISQAERDGVQDKAIKELTALVDNLVTENNLLRKRMLTIETQLSGIMAKLDDLDQNNSIFATALRDFGGNIP